MKKLLLLLLSLTLCLGMGACQTENNDQKNLEGSLGEILEQIYDNADVDASFRDFVENGLYTTEITAENVSYYLGKEGLEFEAAIASEPVMMPSAYSLCLVRVKDGTDIEQMKADIKENVNPMKWICVGVDPSNIIVDNIGDVIFLLMSDNETQALYDAFLSLKG